MAAAQRDGLVNTDGWKRARPCSTGGSSAWDGSLVELSIVRYQFDWVESERLMEIKGERCTNDANDVRGELVGGSNDDGSFLVPTLNCGTTFYGRS